MANNRIAYLKWCLLFGFVLVTYFLPLNGRLLWQPDELRYAEISRELIISYNWSVPELLDIRYFEKPIFGYWVGAVFQMLFGENNISVRLGVVFSTLASGLFVYLSAKMAWKNSRLAFNAVFIYLSMLMVFTIGTYNILDPIVTAFITMVIFFFQWGLTTKYFSHKLLAFMMMGVACGLGVLTKGFLVLVLPVLVCSVAAIYFKQFKEVFVFSFVSLFTALSCAYLGPLLLPAVSLISGTISSGLSIFNVLWRITRKTNPHFGFISLSCSLRYYLG
ncbi:phospholipid carrier-dependent glycosyltransferase [Providencia hangzhouensis]